MSNTITRAELIKPLMDALFDEMNRTGTSEVTVDYDGSGDSGAIENITPQDGLLSLETVLGNFKTVNGYRYTDAGMEPCIQEDSHSVESAIESICYDCLERKYSGWENNEGAFGVFTITAEDRKVRLEHNERHIEYETSQEEF